MNYKDILKCTATLAITIYALVKIKERRDERKEKKEEERRLEASEMKRREQDRIEADNIRREYGDFRKTISDASIDNDKMTPPQRHKAYRVLLDAKSKVCSTTDPISTQDALDAFTQIIFEFNSDDPSTVDSAVNTYYDLMIERQDAEEKRILAQIEERKEREARERKIEDENRSHKNQLESIGQIAKAAKQFTSIIES